MNERTLVVIKPGAVKHHQMGSILGALEAEGLRGLKIVEVRYLTMVPAQAQAFYAEHAGQAFFPGLIEHATQGPCLAVVMEGEGAVSRLRALVGPTEPIMGDSRFHLRAKYGFNLPDNALHASDSAAAFERELDIITPKPVINYAEWPSSKGPLSPIPPIEVTIAAEAPAPESSDPAKEALPPGGQFGDAQ